MEYYEYHDYENEVDHICEFFHGFMDDSGNPKYMINLQKIANQNKKILDLDLNDMFAYDEALATKFTGNAKRFLDIACAAADKLMPQSTNRNAICESDPIDTILYSLAQHQNKSNEDYGSERMIPPELYRKYQLRVEPLHINENKLKSIRNISSTEIGKIVTTRALVTHVSNVKPQIKVCTYLTDLDTGKSRTLFQVVRCMSFMPYTEISGRLATKFGVKNGSKVLLQTRGSKFDKFQEIKIQETSQQIPAGSVPRTLKVHARGELTRLLKPGEETIISGIFMPEPFYAFRRGKIELFSRTYLEALNIQKEKQTYNHELSHLSELRRQNIISFAKHAESFRVSLYHRLSRSIAPEIYGYPDIKKALLLLLVGGVTREQSDGTRNRGDLHICLMGDPGVAKSQLLKFICNVAPRTLYTNGRSSSSVGLTASIVQDPVNNETTLEAGALVLSDMGICCIDEFDKMDEIDRTSIHEVMEQQTVSITKAGINITLNARTSILAAANPAYGSYDISRSPTENIDLPASLLSRFDLLWLILDKSDEELDTKLAQHVIFVHNHKKPPKLEIESSIELESETSMQKSNTHQSSLDSLNSENFISQKNENKLLHAPLAPDVLRSFIAIAREYDPYVPENLTEWLAVLYAEIRKEEAHEDYSSSYTTARTLLSILRLSQAVARLRFSEVVSNEDIEESLRLMRISKSSLFQRGNVSAHHNKQDELIVVSNKIRKLVREKSKSQSGHLKQTIVIGRDEIFQHLRNDHTDESIAFTLEQYKTFKTEEFFMDGSGNLVVEPFRTES